MHIEIDSYSGFCFGVQKAIDTAEHILSNGESLICLGEIVHNKEEVDRLLNLGMKTEHSIDKIQNKTVLLRSHGEAPATYTTLNKNQNKIIDATCPVVLKLQQRVKKSYLENQNQQLVIFGKKGHAEVVGLNGQTNNNAIIITTIDDLDQLDFNRPIELFSQTTMPLDTFQEIKKAIEAKATNKVLIHDTICRQVANRVPRIKAFSMLHDVILFVSGKNSSNGKLLFDVSKKANHKSYLISSTNEINPEWFINVESVGICGATSTPMWLMEDVKLYIETNM